MSLDLSSAASSSTCAARSQLPPDFSPGRPLVVVFSGLTGGSMEKRGRGKQIDGLGWGKWKNNNRHERGGWGPKMDGFGWGTWSKRHSKPEILKPGKQAGARPLKDLAGFAPVELSQVFLTQAPWRRKASWSSYHTNTRSQGGKLKRGSHVPGTGSIRNWVWRNLMSSST